ncbi:GntR family transcriptional regulator [Nonomuraea sp. NPDC049400]|uniref:GntR family transcriptional regulator n=1 Tax=Nonomuraea sp. NPDC049400 TaxID=3364352 RepID=UPI00379C8A3E
MAERQLLYAHIAAAIQADIEAGKYVPGDRLPSEAELRRKFGNVSTHTIREAFRVLQEAGLTRAEHGRGVFVRAYQREVVAPAQGGGTSGDPAHLVEVTRMVAPPHIADLMHGEEQVVRRVANRDPQVKSYYPRRVLEALPELDEPFELAETDHELMARAGVTIASETVDVIARMPTRLEANTLGLTAGTPVLEYLIALADAAGRVMVVREALLRGDANKLRIELR